MSSDFSCSDIEWSTMQVLERVPKRPIQTKLFTVIQDHCLSKMVIREDKNLDLLFTNSPSPVNRVKGMPTIAKQIMTFTEYDIKAI